MKQGWAQRDDELLGIEPFGEEIDLIDRVRKSGRAGLRVYRVDRPMVVLGRSGRPWRDLDVEAVLADGVPLFRRLGGGGAVVLTPGTVQVETAGFIAGPLRLTEWLSEFSAWLARGLNQVGRWSIERSDVCDLTLGVRKVAGACLYRSRKLVHYSVSILAQAPVGLMERYLRHPGRQPAYRAGRSHSDFVTSLNLPADRLAHELVQSLSLPDMFTLSTEKRKTRDGLLRSPQTYRPAGTGLAVP